MSSHPTRSNLRSLNLDQYVLPSLALSIPRHPRFGPAQLLGGARGPCRATFTLAPRPNLVSTTSPNQFVVQTTLTINPNLQHADKHSCDCDGRFSTPQLHTQQFTLRHEARRKSKSQTWPIGRNSCLKVEGRTQPLLSITRCQ